MSSKKSMLVAVVCGVCISFAALTYLKAKTTTTVASSPTIVVTISNPIQIVGSSDDGRYPIYDIDNKLGEPTYHSSKGVYYKLGDLPARMIFIAEADEAGGGAYKCIVLCRDLKDRVVGLNPTFARMYGKHPAHIKELDAPPLPSAVIVSELNND